MIGFPLRVQGCFYGCYNRVPCKDLEGLGFRVQGLGFEV